MRNLGRAERPPSCTFPFSLPPSISGRERTMETANNASLAREAWNRLEHDVDREGEAG